MECEQDFHLLTAPALFFSRSQQRQGGGGHRCECRQACGQCRRWSVSRSRFLAPAEYSAGCRMRSTPSGASNQNPAGVSSVSCETTSGFDSRAISQNRQNRKFSVCRASGKSGWGVGSIRKVPGRKNKNGNSFRIHHSVIDIDIRIRRGF